MANVSFFIPAYNCAATIVESINSILETNFEKGDELVIVNDCSTDNTVDVLAALKNKHPAIKIITHDKNRGGARARNTAIENTSNELLFCLDSDNVLEKNSIRPLLTFMKEQQAEIACFETLKYFSETILDVNEEWSFKSGVFSVNDLFTGSTPPATSGNYLFTKDSWVRVNGYTEDLGALDTYSLGFKQLLENCKMVVKPNSYYFHRWGHESYYIRDAFSKQRSVSLRLIKLIINYIDRIHPDDVNYIFSKKGRYTWLDNLKEHPIRLIDPEKSEKIWEANAPESSTRKLINGIKYYRNRILQLLKIR
jgi:glycosyltransferase involved in cell wall biosynthesis